MKKSIGVFCLVLACCSFYRCAYTVYYEPMIKFDKKIAAQSIEEMKKRGVILLIPTEQKKGRLLKVTGKTKKMAALVKFRKKIAKTLIYSFDGNFDFCPIYYMPDSLYHNYMEGIKGNYFLNRDLKFDSSISPQIKTNFKILTYGYQHLYIIKDEDAVPYPFPNRTLIKLYLQNYQNLWTMLLGIDIPYKDLSSRVDIWTMRLEEYHLNPDRKLYYDVDKRN